MKLASKVSMGPLECAEERRDAMMFQWPQDRRRILSVHFVNFSFFFFFLAYRFPRLLSLVEQPGARFH